MEPGPTGILRRSASKRLWALGCERVATALNVPPSRLLHYPRQMDAARGRPTLTAPSPKPLVVHYLSRMSDETYDAGRARNLEALLRALAERIRALDEKGALLEQTSELMRLIGDVRSELF